MIINHNLASLNTLNALSKNESATQSSLAKLSSGLRINSAADDAAGLAISEKMRGQIRGLDQAKSNSQDGISLVQTAEGALNETTSILQRMRELAVQASNDTATDSDRTACQKEVAQLKSEINRISSTTQFNTKNLLDGSLAAGSSTALGTKLNSVALETSATQGSSVGKSAITYPITITSTANQIKLNVDGGGAQEITIAAGTYTAASDLVSAVNTAIGNNTALAGKVTAEVTSSGELSFVSASTGTSSTVAVTAGTNDATAALGFTTKVETAGAAAKTTVSGGTSGTATGTVVISAGLTVTTSASTLKITLDGASSGTDITIAAKTYSTANDFLGAVNDAINATALKGKVTASLDSSNHLVFTSATTGTSSKVTVAAGTSNSGLTALMSAATTTSGSATSSAGVDLSTLATASLTITSGTNDKINLAVDGGTGVDITVAAGTYTASADLLTAVQSAIDNSSLKGKVTASVDGTSHQLVFTSATTGANSSVAVTASSGNAGLSAMYGTAGGSTAGTGVATAFGTGSTDTLVSLADADGNNYGLKSGNQINISVLVGGEQKTAKLAVTSTTTLQDLADKIHSAIGGSSSVTISNNEIKITGQAGTANEVSNLTISAQTSATDTTATAANFNSDLSAYSETQAATDIKADGSLTFQIGANQNQTMTVDINKMDVESLALSSVDVSTQAGAESAITVIDSATSAVSTERAKLGAYENRLDHTINNLTTTSQNMTTAESRIRDVDMASEMANYQKNSVLQQAAQAMLAQANQQPQQVLSLLK